MVHIREHYLSCSENSENLTVKLTKDQLERKQKIPKFFPKRQRETRSVHLSQNSKDHLISLGLFDKFNLVFCCALGALHCFVPKSEARSQKPEAADSFWCFHVFYMFFFKGSVLFYFNYAPFSSNFTSFCWFFFFILYKQN